VRFDSIYRVLFLIYCVEAGLFLVFAPWTASWEQVVLLLPFPMLRSVLTASGVRGLVTGFGLVHFVWVAHDLDRWIRGDSRRHAALP